MAGLADLIDAVLPPKPSASAPQDLVAPACESRDSLIVEYRANQAELREQGFNAYNSDYVDEFPKW